MTSRELADAIEVIHDRLYWVALHTAVPKNTMKSHYLTVDTRFVYQPFFADFGPLDLSCVTQYCRLLDATLKDPALTEKRIIHFCSHDPKKRANAAFLICAYRVIVLRETAEAAFEPFCSVYPPFLAFRDALRIVCTYQCSILDCLKGLEKAIEIGWYDWVRFDVESYDFFGQVENGDMNWIVPDKFLAFAGPYPQSVDADGFPAFTPEDYVPIFRDGGISLVVRLNHKQYDRRRFIDHGIKHVDLYFTDGSCPSNEIITKFLHIVENEPGAVGVHCKAGLGRTGTLIGLHCMKHMMFPSRAFIGWNRICRPGSILGAQQQFLCDMEREMFQAGFALRGPGRMPPGAGQSERDLVAQMQGLTLGRQRTAAELAEDVGQGEYLCGARRGQGGDPSSHSLNMFAANRSGGRAADAGAGCGDARDKPNGNQRTSALMRGLQGIFRK